MTFTKLIRQPSAFLPVGMSVAALGLVVGHLALFGATRGGDEGAAARVFQLLMAAQLPIMVFFAIRWLPQAPKSAFGVLLLQVGAAVAALAPIFLLEM